MFYTHRNSRISWRQLHHPPWWKSQLPNLSEAPEYLPLSNIPLCPSTRDTACTYIWNPATLLGENKNMSDYEEITIKLFLRLTVRGYTRKTLRPLFKYAANKLDIKDASDKTREYKKIQYKTRKTSPNSGHRIFLHRFFQPLNISICKIQTTYETIWNNNNTSNNS